MRVALDPGWATSRSSVRWPGRSGSSAVRRIESSSSGPGGCGLRRLEPYAALQAFRRGELDEAPVPQGEIRALEAHPTLSPLSEPARCGGSTSSCCLGASLPALRRVFRLTVPRGEYQALISERVAAPAYGLRLGAEPTGPADARAARGSIRGLSPSPLTLGVADRRSSSRPSSSGPSGASSGFRFACDRERATWTCASSARSPAARSQRDRRRRPARLGRRSSPRLTARSTAGGWTGSALSTTRACL